LKDKDKIVKVFMENPEAKMKLRVKGVNNAIKIMKAFDEGCTEIREKESES
jgi:hypothetical protein